MIDRVTYTRLSLEVGMFAQIADEHLGREHFIPRVREKGWELTDALLAEWKAEAVAMGVPAPKLELTQQDKSMIAENTVVALALQANLGWGPAPGDPAAQPAEWKEPDRGTG